jgi:hypothetical protein
MTASTVPRLPPLLLLPRLILLLLLLLSFLSPLLLLLLLQATFNASSPAVRGTNLSSCPAQALQQQQQPRGTSGSAASTNQSPGNGGILGTGLGTGLLQTSAGSMALRAAASMAMCAATATVLLGMV